MGQNRKEKPTLTDFPPKIPFLANSKFEPR